MEILTTFQKRILAAIGHSALAPSFYLTGGTALAVYHLQHRYYEQANQKHVGMTHYWLALAMRNVLKVQFLPRMIKPLRLATLQDHFLGLANQLMTEIQD